MTITAMLLAQNGGGGGSPVSLLPAVVVCIVLMYFIVVSPEKRRERDLQKRLETLKKNDRVVTVGGIYGVVTNVKREADEVTMKIDEETNSKMRVTLRSIARVLEDTASEEAAAKS